MRAFLTAKERFAVHLRPEDVHAALPSEHRPAAPDAVVKALDSLVGWGNLRADPDTSRVTAVEDFYRRRFIYQLTQAGEAAEQALSVYDEALGRHGVLRRVAGDEDAYVSGTGDVLYDVQRRVLAGLLAARHGPSTITADGFEERLDQLTAESALDSDELRFRAIRQRLTRLLLDDPVLYYDELSDEELAYLTRQRAFLTAASAN
jgi:hypothetical protein